MPLYDFKCDCGVTEEFTQCGETPRCKICGKLKQKIFTAPRIKSVKSAKDKHLEWLHGFDAKLKSEGFQGMDRYYNMKTGEKRPEKYKQYPQKKWSIQKTK